MTGDPDHEGRERRSQVGAGRAIAIVPDSARTRHAALLAALAEAYPVTFTGLAGGDAPAAAVIVFPAADTPDASAVPSLTLVAPGAPECAGVAFEVELAREAALERPLRGQRLREDGRRPPAAVPAPAGATVLARVAGRPVWVRDGEHEVAAAVPDELGAGEFLREGLRAGRFWSLLPLVHFVRGIAGDAAPPRPLHACLVIDDPNIRRPAYGHVRYAELARDAREHGYHVAIATIPLDLLLPGDAAAGVFRASPNELSLAVHGNDHVQRELERVSGEAAADRLVRSALARVGRFEARAGLRVDRVMCPPHGACGPDVLGALFRAGFLGLAASRPFPWDAFADRRSWRLGGWLPAQLTGGGLPVLPRHPIGGSLDDLVFRALLGQPLIVYCHHSDLADGLEPFRAVAARAAELGDVRFCSLAAIARSSAVCRLEGAVATVTMFGRDVRVTVPSAAALRVEIPRTYAAADRLRVTVGAEAYAVEPQADGSALLQIARPAAGPVRIRIDALDAGADATVGARRPGAWPLARRVLTELRDRSAPLRHPPAR